MGPRLVLTAILSISSFAFAGCAGQAPKDDAPEVRTPTYLFVQDAANGTLQKAEDGRQALVLTGVDDETLWFTDRPDRDAGLMMTRAFASVWSRGNDSFADDPPNAALVLHEDSGAAQVFVMELSSLRYDPVGGLAYVVRPLDPAHAFLEEHANAQHIAQLPSTFSDIALFIDASENWCLFAYGEACAAAYCDTKHPEIYDHDKCVAQHEADEPQYGPPPTCPSGQEPIKYAQGGWGCVDAAPITCPAGTYTMGPRAVLPPPFNQWHCETGFGSFAGYGTPR